MILVYGSKELEAELEKFTTTQELNKASMAVIEMPGNKEILQQVPDTVPVFAVLTKNLTFGDYQVVNRSNVTKTTLEKVGVLVEQQLEKSKVRAPNITPTGQVNQRTPISFDEPEEDHNVSPGRKPISFEDDAVEEKPVASSRPQPPPQVMAKVRKDIFTQRSLRGYVAAIFSSEGGSGKTTTTSNIACAAALNGVDTVAVDLDITYGDLEISVGLIDPEDENRQRVADKKAVVPRGGWATVSQWRKYASNLKPSILRHSSGLYILPIFPYVGNDLPKSEVEELLLTLSDIFSFVVVDLGVDSKSDHARVVLNMADIIFYVGKQDTKTLGKGHHFISQGEAKQNIAKTKLVINMADPSGFYDSDKIAKRLGFGDYDEIPLDIAGITAAKRSQQMAMQIECDAGLAFNEIAAKHLPFNLTSKQRPATENKGSFFSRILKMFARR